MTTINEVQHNGHTLEYSAVYTSGGINVVEPISVALAHFLLTVGGFKNVKPVFGEHETNQHIAYYKL
jgi:hypothetical protein